jgi:ribosomal protein S18 acetylase RimI-like enzyme
MIIKRLNKNEADLALEAVKNIKLKDDVYTQNKLTLDYLYDYLSNHRNYVFVAIENGQAIGLLYSYRLQRIDRNQDAMFLYEIEVDQRYRNIGIGSRLIEELKKVCRKENIMKMWVGTNSSNLAAMRMYTKTGGKESFNGDDEIMFTYFPPYK